jgi:hypothetical protein
MTCRFDRDAGDYLTDDGSPCRRDDYGDPTHHCTARRTCSQHVGPGELTCARCLGRTRQDLRRIPELADLMPPEAEVVGLESEALNLAGPAADPEAWTWRKVAARQGRAWHLSLIEDDDEHHPYLVLGRWDLMLREDYGQPSDTPATIANAAAYLDRQLGRVAQDSNQDFPLLAREIRKCRAHLESVLRDSQAKDRGAPCPDCSTGSDVAPRMVREYGHWCEDPDCQQQFHFSIVVDGETGEVRPDTSGDVWICPRNPSHWRTHADYERWVEQRATRAG